MDSSITASSCASGDRAAVGFLFGERGLGNTAFGVAELAITVCVETLKERLLLGLPSACAGRWLGRWSVGQLGRFGLLLLDVSLLLTLQVLLILPLLIGHARSAATAAARNAPDAGNARETHQVHSRRSARISSPVGRDRRRRSRFETNER
jgi:hypothetical protein